MADIVLPATMFMEHDDLYYGGGHQHISVGAKADRSARRMPLQSRGAAGLGARGSKISHPGFEMTPRELIDATLEEERPWRHRRPGGRHLARSAAGFPHLALSRRLCACRQEVPLQGRLGASAARHGRADGRVGQDAVAARSLAVIEEADEAHPFRLATSPSRSFLNTSFNETPSSQAREGAPSVMIHPVDAAVARRSPMAMP